MKKKLTNNAGAPVVGSQNSLTTGPRGHSLCWIGSFLFLAGLVPFSGYSVPARGGETPPSRFTRNRAH
jgi:catalase